MAIFRGVGSVGDIADNSLLEEITAKATAAEASATSASSSATTATTKAAEAATSATSALNTELTSASFSTANGVLTLTKQDSETVTTDLDGRYLPLSGGTLTGDLKLGDTDKVTFGAGDDLEIYHENNTTVIAEKNPNGSLFVRGSALVLQASGTDGGGGNNYIEMGGTNDPVTLKYDGNTRLATTNAGITVTGTLTATGYNDSNWNTAYNNHITGVNYTSGNNTLTLTQQDGGTLTTTINAGVSSQWTTSGSDIHYSSGNVGIGTGNPSGKLHVSNGTSGATVNSNADDLIIESATNAGISILGDGNETQYLMFGDAANSAVGRVLYDHTTNHMGLWTNASEAMRITSSGNVGIGTTDPKELFTVDNKVSIHNGGHKLIAFGYTPSDSNKATQTGHPAAIRFDNNNALSFEIDLQDRAVGDVSTRTTVLTCNKNGNVGIGTASPTSTLQVNGTNPQVSITNSQNKFLSFDVALSADTDTQFITVDQADALAFGEKLEADDVVIENEWMRINSSGNVGIGKTDPSTALDVSGTVTATSLAIPDLSIGTVSGNTVISESGSGNFLLKGAAVGITDTNDHVHLLATGDSVSLYYDNVSVLNTIDGGIDVVGKTKSDTFQADGGGSASAPVFTKEADVNTGMYFPAADTIAFSEGGTERMRINSDGKVLINTTSAGTHSSQMRVNGRIQSNSIYATSNSSKFFEGGNFGYPTIVAASYSSYSSSSQKIISFTSSQGTEFGSIAIVGAATAYNTSSDARLKENIQDANDAGSKIDAIQIRQFDWKSEYGGEHQDYGVIAQELKAVAPEAVSEGYTEDDMMSVDYSKLVPTLIKEIQSLRTRVAQLENN